MLDLTRYKRVFAFGCSYTNYVYPTWANIVFSEMPNIEHYNLGKSGAGNTYIANKVIEANTRYKFNEDDLVMVLWSSYYREDRYINGSWQCHGNIFNQGFYNKNFVMNYVDVKGCLIRDFALISLTDSLLKLLPCDSFSMLSSDHNEELWATNDELDTTDVLDTYSEVLNNYSTPMNQVVSNRKHGFVERQLADNTLIDHHPSPYDYYEYLCSINFPLTSKAKTYVDDVMNKLDPYIIGDKQHKLLTREVYDELFPEINSTTQINGQMF